MSDYFLKNLLTDYNCKTLRSGEVSIDCPFCSKRNGSPDFKQHLQINFEKGLGHCYRCDWATRDLKKSLSFIFSREVCSQLQDYIEFEEVADFKEDLEKFEVSIETVTPPKNVLNLLEGTEDEDLQEYILNYLTEERGLTLPEIEYFGFKMLLDEKGHPVIYIPVRDRRNRLYYFYYKCFTGSSKYLFPDTDKERFFGFFIPRLKITAGDILLGEFSNRFSRKEVYIVEGIFDVISLYRLGKFAVGLSGKNFTSNKIKRLKNLKMEKYILLLYPDVPKEQLMRKVKQLAKEIPRESLFIRVLEETDPGDWLLDKRLVPDLNKYCRHYAVVGERKY